MPYEERERLIKFYKTAFDWGMEKEGEEMGNYVTASTTETDDKGRPKRPGAINGGFFPKKPDSPSQIPAVVIAVKDIKKAMQRVTGAGGKVLGEPVEIPTIGMYVSFLDSEGNRVSLLQPNPM